jgi:hypothetical protein
VPDASLQEARSCLDLETTRGWCWGTVLRAAPCLLGLYTAVALLYREFQEQPCNLPLIVWELKRKK